MAEKTLLGKLIQNDKDILVEPSAYIEITKKTVRFGRNVYQFSNITGFGLVKIQNNYGLPIFCLILLLAAGGWLMTDGFRNYRWERVLWGGASIFIGIYAIIMILRIPTPYGFELELNSGKSRIITTRDIEGVKKIVSTLYDFMENEAEKSLVVNIDQRNASIGVGYGENVHAQNIGASNYSIK
ncbi:hypothetical protein CAL7716_059960 [Calothrix sp. PCC 7716]|nr:hypothetical protein CAL7716_059960 [Calothrix sp. PCC 7716]